MTSKYDVSRDSDDYCCENTWLRSCNNEVLSKSGLLMAMKWGFVKFDDMPKDVKLIMNRYLFEKGYIKNRYFKQSVQLRS